MSIKPTLIYALSLTLGIAAVTHAKTLLIEQTPQKTNNNQELVYRTDRADPYESDWIQHRQIEPAFSYVPGHWSRWTV